MVLDATKVWEFSKWLTKFFRMVCIKSYSDTIVCVLKSTSENSTRSDITSRACYDPRTVGSEDAPTAPKKWKLTRTPPSSVQKESSQSGRRTPKQTEMLKLRLQNLEHLTRTDDLALSRRQEREMDTIRR